MIPTRGHAGVRRQPRRRGGQVPPEMGGPAKLGDALLLLWLLVCVEEEGRESAGGRGATIIFWGVCCGCCVVRGKRGGTHIGLAARGCG